MKTTFTLLFVIVFCIQVFSQTATSVANGNWLMPTTWDCACIPTATYNVNINHTVTMTSNWMQTGGTVTINIGGTLKQDATNRIIAFNGGNLANHGTFTFSKVAFLSGTFSNTGTLNGTDSLYMGVDMTNAGYVTSNNLYNAAVLNNNYSVVVTNFFNNGTFDNVMPAGWLNALNFYNNLTAINSGYIAFGNCTNAGVLTNNGGIGGDNDFTNAGILYNNLGSTINITNDCTNGDTLNNDAHWYNNGITNISNDFTNVDSLHGTAPGSFCVYNNSVNLGAVLGDFDFCDHLTTGFGINSGTISNGITYCSGLCYSKVIENNISDFEVFPNPVKESLTIQFNGDIINNYLQIVNSCGQVVFEQAINEVKEITVSRNSLPAGLYLLKVSNDHSLITKKLIFE